LPVKEVAEARLREVAGLVEKLKLPVSSPTTS
jgi:hypothetical protein